MTRDKPVYYIIGHISSAMHTVAFNPTIAGWMTIVKGLSLKLGV